LYPKVKLWLSGVTDLSLQDPSIFSRMRVRKMPLTIFLEPLAFNLIDPRSTCPNLAAPEWKSKFEKETKSVSATSKEFLVLPPNRSYLGSGKIKYFDLGASFYDGHPVPPDEKESVSGWGSSGKWFVDEYEKRGMPIDHMYLWEKNTDEAEYRAAGLPERYSHRISFFHYPVQADGGGPQNPFNTIKKECKTNDYCILKMDFDTPEVENAIFNKLLSNTDGILDLVDEFFWDPVDHDISKHYTRLLSLRQLGVRAHSWV